MIKIIHLLICSQLAITAYANDDLNNLELFDPPSISFKISCIDGNIEISDSKKITEEFQKHRNQLGEKVPEEGKYWWNDTKWVKSNLPNENVPSNPIQQYIYEKETLKLEPTASVNNISNNLTLIDKAANSKKITPQKNLIFIYETKESIKNPPKHLTRGRPKKVKLDN